VQTFVPTNQFVREAEAWEETSMFEPKDGTKGTGEENAFDSSEGNDAVGKRTAARITPAESPVRFLLDAGNLLHGMEEMPLFLGVIGSVRVNEERVHFIVNVPFHALKVVEAACFGELDLSREVFDEVLLVDDAVRGGKESEDVLD